MKIDWTSPKKLLWPVNVFTFNMYRLNPGRDKRLWVFGAWEGEKYDDNARALFEYVNSVHSNTIHCVWLTNSENTVELVRSLGYEAYTSDSRDGIAMQKKAGVAIYTNGVMDFGLHPKVAGALIVSLWHGVGFKKTYNEKYSGWKLFIKETMDKLFSWTYRDLTVAPSQYVVKQFTGIFSLGPRDKVAITGQPRNDVFRMGLRKEDVIKDASIDVSKTIVLYMPTYRSNGLAANAMENIVRRLYDNKKLHEVLVANNCVFVAKLHPMAGHIDIANRDDFVVLDNKAVESNQKLLAVSDMLITDYSSCIVDFALTERPVIFYTPDHEDFIAKSEPIYDEFFAISKLNCCDTPEDLAKKIANPSLAAVEAINALYEDPSIKGTCYSENVYNVIAKNIFNGKD